MTAPCRVAVMQPYFLPYAGYFRLMVAADTFVIYDCVQFIRRGRIHRCQLPGTDGAPLWLTLPLAAATRDTRLDQIRFASNARSEFDSRLSRVRPLWDGDGPGARRVRDWLQRPLEGLSLCDYLESGLREVAGLLDLQPRIIRSSSLRLDPQLRGQDRVIAAVQAVGGVDYVNAPGGAALYDVQRFEQAHLGLFFLTPYEGPYRYMLPALMRVMPALIADDIRSTTQLVGADQMPEVAQPKPPRPKSSPL